MSEKTETKEPSQLQYCVPGKVFLLGEYLVVSGGPAILATLGPRFQFLPGGSFHPHKLSPAGRLLGENQIPYTFQDPHQGRGGLGASSAQFALLFSQMTRSQDWKKAWELYRTLHPEEKICPSGADLVAQINGGVRIFEPREKRVSENLFSKVSWKNLLIWTAPHRKVATHTHLEDLSKKGFPYQFSERLAQLELISFRAIDALREGDLKTFSNTWNEYANVLWRMELEDPQAHEDRLSLQERAGVWGVKGMGALQSDGILVLMDPQASEQEIQGVLQEAQKRDLQLLQHGLFDEEGLRVQ